MKQPHRAVGMASFGRRPDEACAELSEIIGKNAAAPWLLQGLKRLEYRGYDSAGKAKGKDKSGGGGGDSGGGGSSAGGDFCTSHPNHRKCG